MIDAAYLSAGGSQVPTFKEGFPRLSVQANEKYLLSNPESPPELYVNPCKELKYVRTIPSSESFVPRAVCNTWEEIFSPEEPPEVLLHSSLDSRLLIGQA